MLKSENEEHYAQSFKSFLAHYNYVVIKAMPFEENTNEPNHWLADLVTAATRQPKALEKSVFELQTVNWKTNELIPMPVFSGQVELLKKQGVQHIAYYPDDVFPNQPHLRDIKKLFSLPVLP